MYTYSIKGIMTYTESNDTEDGLSRTEIDEEITVDYIMHCESVLMKFLEDNEHYNFFGTLKTCDVETHGCLGATYIDQNEEHTIDIELLTSREDGTYFLNK